jgi:hypothetical protein
MSFRRQRDDWDDFLKHHGAELRECGIPDYVVAKKMRFLVFLEHGYDDWGRAENQHAFFHPRDLTDEQISRFAELVGKYIDERYRSLIESRWQKSPYDNLISKLDTQD